MQFLIGLRLVAFHFREKRHMKPRSGLKGDGLFVGTLLLYALCRRRVYGGLVLVLVFFFFFDFRFSTHVSSWGFWCVLLEV